MTMEMWIRALKSARAGAGVSQEKLAEMINYSTSLIAQIETGRRRPTMALAIAADAALQTDGLLAHLLKQANSQHPPTWFAPWLKAEREATWLRTSHPGLVPGLLQTEAYARALFSAGGQYEPDEEEELIAERLERQTMLTGERPKRLIAVLDELALRRIIGGREVAEEQLRHLLDMAQRPNVTLHVIPADAGAYPGIGGGFILATMPEGDVVVYLENAAVGELMDRPETVDMMQRKWDSLLGRAMPEQISLAIIEKLMGEL